MICFSANKLKGCNSISMRRSNFLDPFSEKLPHLSKCHLNGWKGRGGG